MVPDTGALPDHAVIVEGGRIRDVLPSLQVSQRYPDGTVEQLHAHVLMPGLVNCHTHAAMSLFRGLADDLALQQWLEQRIWPAEQRHVSERFVADGARLACAEMLRNGITCFNDMYYYPDATATVAAEVGLRCRVGLRVLPGQRALHLEPEDSLEGGLRIHDRWRRHPLVGTTLAPHSPRSLSGALMRTLGRLSRDYDLRLHMHVHETGEEVADYMSLHGVSPLQRMHRQGLVGPRLLAVHAIHLELADRRLLAEAGAHVVHCPRSNLKLGNGLAAVAELLRLGVNVALGTDGAASNNNLDLFGEMRMAALLAKAVGKDPTALPASVALRMATINGARALGLADDIGSLEAGKWADIIAVDVGGIAAHPHFDIVSQLVYATGANQVTDVWIAGRRLLEKRQFLTVDQQAVAAAVDNWQTRVRT